MAALGGAPGSIFLSGGPFRVVGNRIGTNGAGTAAIPNDLDGINFFLDASGVIGGRAGTTPGGPCTGDCNLVSGNHGSGIGASGSIEVLGNYVGTDVTGQSSIGNDGSGVEMDSDGLKVGEPGAGNLISGNGVDGVSSTTGHVAPIQGNLIGTNASGTRALGNGRDGIFLGLAGGPVLIGGSGAGEGNVISGNGRNGILSGSRVGDGVIASNLIGTDKAGSSAIPNGLDGIDVGHDWTVGGTAGTTPGGPCTGACNLISGNKGNGVSVAGASTILGNLIGTDVSGSKGLGNAGDGVVLLGNDTIGGTSPAARNVVAANGGNGVVMTGAPDVAQGNLVGTDVSGRVALGNRQAGIVAKGGTAAIGSGHTIGGTAPGALNLVSGNGGDGIVLQGAAGAVVQGNLIGIGLAGTGELGNGGHGVLVAVDGVARNTIGGSGEGEGNVIGFNSGGGVAVTGPTQENAILRNSIFSNGGLGIDLGDDGVTLNDSHGHFGPNAFQNFPELTSVAGNVVTGTLHSQAIGPFRVELFANSACDPSGYGEGETFLAATSVTTDGAGTGGFSVTLPSPVPAGSVITATATDRDGNTSEFSRCRAGPAAGTIFVGKSCPAGAAAGDRFQVTSNGVPVGDPLACGGSLQVSVAGGTPYAIGESAAGTANLANYTQQLGPGCSGTLAAGGSATCTITNTLKPTGTPCPPSGSVNVRWHYSANGSSGSWSGTKATSCTDGSVSIGPQAMEGDLKLSVGTTLKIGYDFTLPGNKQSFTAKVTKAQVLFTVHCVTGSPLVSTWTVPILDQSYAVSGSAWFPSGDEKSPLVYQGSATVPGGLCSSGQVRLDKGGTFSATILLS